ncbi:unnamed protein product [Pylaiella littoralis]
MTSSSAGAAMAAAAATGGFSEAGSTTSGTTTGSRTVGGSGSTQAGGGNPPWWNAQGSSPRLPPPPDCDSGNNSSTAATAGGEEGAAARRRFWRGEYGANEFASVRRASERVTLNLSGTTFITTRDTLARNPDTYFSAMLRMQAPTTPGSSNGSGSTTIASASVEDEESNNNDDNNSINNSNSNNNPPLAEGEGGGRAARVGRSGSTSSSSSSDGMEFFIDRDPTHFRFILNYLRDSYIGLESFGKEDLHFLEELSHEAQFFNIAGLCSDISRRMSDIARQHREGPSGDKDFRLVQCSTSQIQDLFHEWVIEKNYEFECMQIVGDTAYIVLGRRVSRGELALVERLMKT